MSPDEVVRTFWASMENRDWEQAASLLAPDVSVIVPVSGEVFQGRDAVVTYNRTYPGEWHVAVVRSVGNADQVAVEVKAINNGVREACLGFYNVRDGQIVQATEWWAMPTIEPDTGLPITTDGAENGDRMPAP